MSHVLSSGEHQKTCHLKTLPTKAVGQSLSHSTQDFEHVETRFRAKGLCLPGLGRLVYKAMGGNLLELVVRTLPTRFHEVHAQVNVVRGDCRNGYDLLWRVGTLICPVWNVSEPPSKPAWCDDIWRYVNKWKLWRTLCRHQGSPISKHELSRQFLLGLRSLPMYNSAADSRLVYLTLSPPLDPGDGSLEYEWPVMPGWSVDELAAALQDGVKTVDVADMNLRSPPRVNRFEGTAPNSGDRSPGGDRLPGGDRPGRRRLPRPNARRPRNRRQPIHRSPCEACGKYGHPADRCIFLAMYLYVKKYAANRDNAAVIDTVLQNWVERNKEWLGDEPEKGLATVVATARRFAVESSYPEHELTEGTDWDFFADGADDPDDGICFDAAGNVVLPTEPRE